MPRMQGRGNYLLLLASFASWRFTLVVRGILTNSATRMAVEFSRIPLRGYCFATRESTTFWLNDSVV